MKVRPSPSYLCRCEAIIQDSCIFIALGNKTIKALRQPFYVPAKRMWLIHKTYHTAGLGFLVQCFFIFLLASFFPFSELIEEKVHPLACACMVSLVHSVMVSGYSMPLRRIWLAAISMTLIIKAMAKAHIRLFRTQVCLFCFWECTRAGREKAVVKVRCLYKDVFCKFPLQLISI